MNEQPETPPGKPGFTRATAHLGAEHLHETGALQYGVDRITSVVGMPGFVTALTLALIIWVFLNSLAQFGGLRAIDPPPFHLLQGLISVGAFYIAVLILTTQLRKDQLASHHAALALELVILNDQKLSKIIALIEEARRDNPLMGERSDNDANAMSTPADHHLILEVIKGENGEALTDAASAQ